MQPTDPAGQFSRWRRLLSLIIAFLRNPPRQDKNKWGSLA